MSDDSNNEDNDKTQEVAEQVEDDGAVGGNVDSDSGIVLTIDGDDDSERTGDGK